VHTCVCRFARVVLEISGDEPTDEELKAFSVRREEEEVRDAVLATICRHLNPGPPENPSVKHWQGMSLDLRGASIKSLMLVAANFSEIDIDGAVIDKHFGLHQSKVGSLSATKTFFNRDVWIASTEIADMALFRDAYFNSPSSAKMNDVQFPQATDLDSANFRTPPELSGSTMRDLSADHPFHGAPQGWKLEQTDVPTTWRFVRTGEGQS
jgi:hypothetical protein